MLGMTARSGGFSGQPYQASHGDTTLARVTISGQKSGKMGKTGKAALVGVKSPARGLVPGSFFL